MIWKGGGFCYFYMAEIMKLNLSKEDDMQIIDIEGELDIKTSEKMEKSIISILENEKKIILLMDKCSYISTEGLKSLLLIAKQIKKAGAKGVICGLIDEVREVIEITGFDIILKCCNNLQEAIQLIKEEKNA